MEQIQVGDSNSGGGNGRKDEAVSVGSRFDTLPEDCISMVISRTSPRDACVVASVSKTVKSAAQSDLVWETFLPPEHSSLAPRSLNLPSKKAIYLSLADDSVLIDDGKKVKIESNRNRIRFGNVKLGLPFEIPIPDFSVSILVIKNRAFGWRNLVGRSVTCYQRWI